MRRWLLIAILGLLIADASGIAALAIPETCSLTSAADQAPDGACPAFCARCSCCAIPVLHATAPMTVTSLVPPRRIISAIDGGLPVGSSPDILHVPKPHLA